MNRSIYRDVPDRRQRVGIAVGVTDVNNTARTLAGIFDNSPTSGDGMPFEAECVAGFTRLLESDPFLVGQKFVMHIRRDGIRLGRADADMPGSLEPGGRLRSITNDYTSVRWSLTPRKLIIISTFNGQSGAIMTRCDIWQFVE